MPKILRATLTCALALTGLAAAACSGPSFKSVAAYTPPAGSPGINVDVISPTLQHQYVFERGTPPVDFQPGSRALADMLRGTAGLHVAALRSTADSAAVFIIEDDPAVPWGTILLPAEKSVFEKFASDPKLGDWLILIDDVIVAGPKDPVPVTAYRWARSDVERYAKCGIPKPGTQNECSKVFFLIARTVILQKSNYVPRGR